MNRHEANDLKKLSKLAAIALATAAIERVLPTAQGHPDIESVVKAMLSELWQWQSAEKLHSKATMPLKDAKALPSGRFYFTYQSRLLELADTYMDQGKVYELLGASIANISFIVWLMDKHERALNPGKPIVLGSDISEVGWGVLAAGLDTAANAADNRDEEFAWQTQMIERLAKDHPSPPDPADFGQPVARAYFFGP